MAVTEGDKFATQIAGECESGGPKRVAVTDDGIIKVKHVDRLATKASSSPLTSGDLFTFTGSIAILAIIGRVKTVIQSQATTVKLGAVCDALAEYDFCAAKDINAFAVGSLLSITGTAADAMVGATGVGAIAPGQVSPVILTCITSGTITVTFGANSTGAIDWEIIWVALDDAGNLEAA